jgi:hypothetical protein
MPVTPRDLKCIPADRFNIHEHDKERHIVGFNSQLPRPLISARGTGTMLTEIPDWVDPLVPVIPFNAEHTLIEPFHVFGFKHGWTHRNSRK